MRTDRETDTYDEANSRFSQFCERPSKLTTLFHRQPFAGKIQSRYINIYCVSYLHNTNRYTRALCWIWLLSLSAWNT